MKYLLSTLCLLFLISTTNAQKKVDWMSWEDAMAEAESNPKKIYVDVYTDWCGYCKKMDNTTFKDEKVVQYLNENFYPVKLNAEQKEDIHFNDTTFKFLSSGSRGVHQLAYALLNGKLGYPAFVILDEEFARILISPGFKGPDAVMMEMKFASDEKYKTVAWNDYMAQYNKPAVANQAKQAPKVDVNAAGSAKPKSPQAGTNTRSANIGRDTIPPVAKKKAPPAPPSNEGETFKVVEEMPRFPGCEDKGLDKNETQKCSEELMLQFIYKNLVYPDKAKKNGVDGMAVVQFVIDEQGKVTNIKLIRDLPDGCGDEAVNVVSKMPDWIPGKQRGKPTKVLYTLPVRFKLKGSSIKKKTKIKQK